MSFGMARNHTLGEQGKLANGLPRSLSLPTTQDNMSSIHEGEFALHGSLSTSPRTKQGHFRQGKGAVTGTEVDPPTLADE